MKGQRIIAGEEMHVSKRSLKHQRVRRGMLLPIALVSGIVGYGFLTKIIFNDDFVEAKSSSQTSATYNEGNTIFDGLEAAALYYNLFGDRGIQNLSRSGILQEIIRNYNP